MSDYLVRLAARSLGLLDVIQPRMTSMFEPPPIDGGLTSEDNFELSESNSSLPSDITGSDKDIAEWQLSEPPVDGPYHQSPMKSVRDEPSSKSETIEPKPIESIQPNSVASLSPKIVPGFNPENIDESSLSSKDDLEHKSIHVSDKISEEPERSTANGDPTKPILQQSTVIASRSDPSTTSIKLSAGDHRDAGESELDKLDHQSLPRPWPGDADHQSPSGSLFDIQQRITGGESSAKMRLNAGGLGQTILNPLLSESSSQSYSNARCSKPLMENCGIIQEPKPAFKDAGSLSIGNIHEPESGSIRGELTSKDSQRQKEPSLFDSASKPIQNSSSTLPSPETLFGPEFADISSRPQAKVHQSIVERNSINDESNAIIYRKPIDSGSDRLANRISFETPSRISPEIIGQKLTPELQPNAAISEPKKLKSKKPDSLPLFEDHPRDVFNISSASASSAAIISRVDLSSSEGISSEPKPRPVRNEPYLQEKQNLIELGSNESAPFPFFETGSEPEIGDRAPSPSSMDLQNTEFREKLGLSPIDASKQAYPGKAEMDIARLVSPLLPEAPLMPELAFAGDKSVVKLQLKESDLGQGDSTHQSPPRDLVDVKQDLIAIRSKMTKGCPTNLGDSSSSSHKLKSESVSRAINHSDEISLKKYRIPFKQDLADSVMTTMLSSGKAVLRSKPEAILDVPHAEVHSGIQKSLPDVWSEEPAGKLHLSETEPNPVNLDADFSDARIHIPIKPKTESPSPKIISNPKSLVSSNRKKITAIDMYPQKTPEKRSELRFSHEPESKFDGNESLEKSNQNRFLKRPLLKGPLPKSPLFKSVSKQGSEIISDGSSRKEQTSSIIKYHSKESINHIITAVEPRRTRIAGRELQASSETAAKTDPRSKIKVTIGRIEVRAATPLSPSQQTNRASMPPVPSAPRLSLDSYLKRRSEGKI